MQVVEIIKQSDLSVYLMETAPKPPASIIASLTENELIRLENIRHPEKKKEFLVSRYLRTCVFGKQEIHYTETGAPYLDHNGFISISHTEGLVGIAFSKTFRTGLDLENIREKAVQLSERFLHDIDRNYFDHTNSFDMSALWSMKETLFKLAGRKAVIFAEQLWITKQPDSYYGHILQPEGTQQFELIIREFNGKLITCNASGGKLLI